MAYCLLQCSRRLFVSLTCFWSMVTTLTPLVNSVFSEIETSALHSNPDRLEQTYTVIWKQSLFCSLWNQGLGSPSETADFHLWYWQQAGNGVGQDKAKTLPSISYHFKLPFSSFQIYLVFVNFLLTRTDKVSSDHSACFLMFLSKGKLALLYHFADVTPLDIFTIIKISQINHF